MLAEPRCFQRNCIHYQGVDWLGIEEVSEVQVCDAFLSGIPAIISYGDELHLKPLENQGNDIVFEKAKE